MAGRSPLDLAGQRFGLLVAVRPSVRATRYGRYWVCRCDCGAKTEVLAAGLRGGKAHSCGCRMGPYVHGGARRSGEHPLYVTWMGMNARCSQAAHKDYYLYGGRGIRVCDRWTAPNGFANFLADMGERPPDPEGWQSRAPYWTIDRIDVEGDYEPTNCRWATWLEQARNRSPWGSRKEGAKT